MVRLNFGAGASRGSCSTTQFEGRLAMKAVSLDVIRPSLPASSSRQRSPSATGLRKPTGKRAAGRRSVAVAG